MQYIYLVTTSGVFLTPLWKFPPVLTHLKGCLPGGHLLPTWLYTPFAPEDMFSDSTSIVAVTSQGCDLVESRCSLEWHTRFKNFRIVFWFSCAPLARCDVKMRGRMPCLPANPHLFVVSNGDCHPENFGNTLLANGNLVFGVNDFDQAFRAPFTWRHDSSKRFGWFPHWAFQKRKAPRQLPMSAAYPSLWAHLENLCHRLVRGVVCLI